MNAAEEAEYVAIIEGKREPDPEGYKAGYAAHAADVPFGDGPRPIASVYALSWRFGWNDRALGKQPSVLNLGVASSSD
jgi:hypothetical protein